jgi:alkanesulfonate monooxygenase SsuD/methylene tetrahydromethanopterin reductase-like flavin-dependent oxidoreductase (luciferase family)
MKIGIDSFVAAVPDALTGENLGPADRLKLLLDEIEFADRVGLDVFGVGEHHRAEFLDSAPEAILAAAAVRTERIRLTSAVTVLSANDPVRVFQQFATIDLLSRGRVEMIVGRGSFVEAFPLFGLNLSDYDSLFASKLELLLKIRDNTRVHWSGPHRAPLTKQAVFPRPYQERLPIWLGVGGTPASFVRAGTLGLPLMVAIIGGEPHRFRPLIDLYREAGRRAGRSEFTCWAMLLILTSKQRMNSFRATRGLSPTLAKSVVGRRLPVASLKHCLSRTARCLSAIPDLSRINSS